MKFVVLVWDVGYNLQRKVMQANDMSSCVRKLLRKVDLSKPIETYECIEQIRIPAEEFKPLRPEVKTALREISEIPTPDYNSDPRWLQENYWAFCKAHIFDFKGISISVCVEWSCEEEKDHEYSMFVTELKHPFMLDFLGCSEGSWGKFEKENIKKWI